MPLHTYYRTAVDGFHAFDYPVGSRGGYRKPFGRRTHRLVVECIHGQPVTAEYSRKEAVTGKKDIMCRHMTVDRLLIMHHEFAPHSGTLVLKHLPTERNRNGLYTAAYAKNRQGTVIGKTHKEQFLLIAFGVYGMQESIIGFLTHVTRVNIGTAGKKQRINMPQGLH
jgi:hypothetical protein